MHILIHSVLLCMITRHSEYDGSKSLDWWRTSHQHMTRNGRPWLSLFQRSSNILCENSQSRMQVDVTKRWCAARQTLIKKKVRWWKSTSISVPLPPPHCNINWGTKEKTWEKDSRRYLLFRIQDAIWQWTKRTRLGQPLALKVWRRDGQGEDSSEIAQREKKSNEESSRHEKANHINLSCKNCFRLFLPSSMMSWQMTTKEGN